MKRIIIVLLSLVMLFAMSACGEMDRANRAVDNASRALSEANKDAQRAQESYNNTMDTLNSLGY